MAEITGLNWNVLLLLTIKKDIKTLNIQRMGFAE